MTLEDGQLMGQATGQLKVLLFAESETKFFLKVEDAQVEFFKNEKGEVAYLMLHQNGRDIKGIKESQFSASYFLEQGSDHYAKGDYEQALRDFNEAIGLDTKSASAFNGRGASYFAKGGYDRAIQDYNEAIRLDSKTPRALLNRGIANLYAGRPSDA